jgi:hypothetical protein
MSRRIRKGRSPFGVRGLVGLGEHGHLGKEPSDKARCRLATYQLVASFPPHGVAGTALTPPPTKPTALPITVQSLPSVALAHSATICAAAVAPLHSGAQKRHYLILALAYNDRTRARPRQCSQRPSVLQLRRVGALTDPLAPPHAARPKRPHTAPQRRCSRELLGSSSCSQSGSLSCGFSLAARAQP